MVAAGAVFLAIETCLQLFDGSAGQHQRIRTSDVIHIGADRRQHIDTDEVRARLGEADVDRVTVDEQRLLQTELLAS
jgi:hypothetical protein